jgi:hypothetical protein
MQGGLSCLHLIQTNQDEPQRRLQPQSPQNGNVGELGRRLLTVRPLQSPKQESGDSAKAAVGGLSRSSWQRWPKPGMPGWRRSADRTSLQANSLISGNFTGNFAILVSQKPISLHQTAVLQPFFVKFPTRIIRENNFKNKEFLNGIRESRNPRIKSPLTVGGQQYRKGDSVHSIV